MTNHAIEKDDDPSTRDRLTERVISKIAKIAFDEKEETSDQLRALKLLSKISNSSGSVKRVSTKQDRTATGQLKILYESLGIWTYVNQCLEKSPVEFLAEIRSIVDVKIVDAQYRIGWQTVAQGLKFLNYIVNRQTKLES